MKAADGLLVQLRSLRDPGNVEGQRRFGITSDAEQLGIAMPVLRQIARGHRRDQELAVALWASGVHDARVLATLVADPAKMTSRLADQWVKGCDNWVLTDSLAWMLDTSEFSEAKALAWSGRSEEFVKRTGFALMAGMALHRKKLPDEIFLRFLPVISRESEDERNFVKKAVNWALRQIGKRNPALRRAAIAEAGRIGKKESRAARWVAADALRELRKA